MKDANMQFENIKVLMMWDNLFEAGLLLCRRVGLFRSKPRSRDIDHPIIASSKRYDAECCAGSFGVMHDHFPQDRLR
jgi:hypothetical protein